MSNPNGETKLLGGHPNKVGEIVSGVESKINGTYAKLGIPAYSVAEEDIRYYLTLDIKKTRLSSVEWAEGAASIAQMNFYLQLEVNKREALLGVLNSRIKKCIAPNLGQHKAWAWEEKQLAGIAYDSFATELDNKRREVQAEYDALRFITARLKELGDKFTEMQRATRNTLDNHIAN